jgi:hypothetical protein
MMLIESFDADTETRRLGPTAFFSGNYVDLMNGPQDHGWCNGYTCLKRISTFIAMILDQTPVGRLIYTNLDDLNIFSSFLSG